MSASSPTAHAHLARTTDGENPRGQWGLSWAGRAGTGFPTREAPCPTSVSVGLLDSWSALAIGNLPSFDRITKIKCTQLQGNAHRRIVLGHLRKFSIRPIGILMPDCCHESIPLAKSRPKKAAPDFYRENFGHLNSPILLKRPSSGHKQQCLQSRSPGGSCKSPKHSANTQGTPNVPFRACHRQSVSNPVFGPPRVSARLQSGLGKVRRPSCVTALPMRGGT